MPNNYIKIIGDCFIGAEAELPNGADPFDYNALVWITAPIAQSVLDASECANPLTSLAAGVPALETFGKIFEATFLYHAVAKNRWISNGTHGTANVSNEVPYIVPFDCKLVALSFSNGLDNIDTDIQVWNSPKDSEPSNATLDFTWQVRNARTAVKTDLPTLAFGHGDKIALYLADQGMDVNSPFVRLTFLVTNYTSVDISEAFSSNF